jgi:hypothetical protein
MKSISTIPAYYPLFTLGGTPQAVFCQLSIIEGDDGKRYLRTPFAFLDAHGDDDHKRQIELGHYYATAGECEAYLAREYPHWEAACPVMDLLCNYVQWNGKLVGEGKLADKLGVSSLNGDLYRLARGHRSVKLATIRKAVKTLAARAVVSA